MRQINRIIWHCAATPEGVDVKTGTIRKWHLARGWRDIGYHYVIELDGSVHVGRTLDQVGAGVQGQNDDSIHICYVGGVDLANKPKDTRTHAQLASLYRLTEELVARFGASVHGHNEYANKACPSFNASDDWIKHTRSLPTLPNNAIPLESEGD